MEENIGLLPMNGHIGSGAFSNRVWRCRNILIVFVVSELLRGICLYRLEDTISIEPGEGGGGTWGNERSLCPGSRWVQRYGDSPPH